LPPRKDPKPSKKVRNFQWAKLPNAKIKGTFFEKLDVELKDFKLNLEEIEERFGVKEVEKKGTCIEPPSLSLTLFLSLITLLFSHTLFLLFSFAYRCFDKLVLETGGEQEKKGPVQVLDPKTSQNLCM
jgi:hypothetical protein